MSEEQLKIERWQLAPNVHHESGEPTYFKKDKHGFTTYATAKMISAAASPVSDAVDMELVKGCVKRLSDLKKYHINPYNLGEQGEVGSLITTLAQLFQLPPPSSPTPTNVQEQDNTAYNKAISDAVQLFYNYWQSDDTVNPSTTKEFIDMLEKLKKPFQSPNQ